jgi:hypothetical protein
MTTFVAAAAVAAGRPWTSKTAEVHGYYEYMMFNHVVYQMLILLHIFRTEEEEEEGHKRMSRRCRHQSALKPAS